jgi:PiT family inorganic phosphate transporter
MQLVSAAFMAFSHGSNDAQKTMGVVTLALVSYGSLSTMDVPLWVAFLCATFMFMGTAAGGWRIIHTMGNRVIKLKPIHGFAAETAAAGVIISSSAFGIPISTTHVISTSIMGVGSTVRFSAVKWGLVGTIVKAWLLTIPVCMLLSAAIYQALQFVAP